MTVEQQESKTDNVNGSILEATQEKSPTDKGAAASLLRQESLRVEVIGLAPEQARKERDPEAFEDLVESVRTLGILQPLLVRRLPSGQLLLLAGHGRLEAAKRCALATVPCQVYDGPLSDAEVLRVQYHENQKREGLSIIDQGRLFSKVAKETGLKQEKLAAFLGVSQPHLSDCLAIFRAPPDIRAKVETKEWSAKRALQELRRRKKQPAATEGNALTEVSPSDQEGHGEKSNGKPRAVYQEYGWSRDGVVIAVSGKRKTSPPVENMIQITEHYLNFLRQQSEKQHKLNLQGRQTF